MGGATPHTAWSGHVSEQVLSPAFVSPERAPGPRYRTLFGWFKAFRTDPIRFLEDCRRIYGPVAIFRAPPTTGFALAHPDWIRHVLETHVDRYWKGRMLSRVASGGAGKGLVFLDGEAWREDRKMIQPAFVRSRVTAMSEAMTRAAADLIARWERRDPAEPFELSRAMAITALDVAGRGLFGVKLAERMESFSDLMTRLLDHSNYLVNHYFVWPRWVPTRRNRAMARDRAILNETLAWIFAERRRDPAAGPDLLSHLLCLHDDPANRFMTEGQLYAECATFLAAGHETTGVTMAFALALLAQHPEAEARVHEEVDRVLGDQPPTRDNVRGLEFTRRVGAETLRLYPPAPVIGREAYGGDEIAGQPVTKGAPVLLSPWVAHRDPDYWDAPERFDPDRFSAEAARGRPRYAYFPFGGGPRRCIGEAFALAEIPIVLASIAQRFRVRLVPGRKVVAKPLFTLRPHGGIWVTLERRRPRS